jgi:hypothetical protein
MRLHKVPIAVLRIGVVAETLQMSAEAEIDSFMLILHKRLFLVETITPLSK